MPNPVLILDDEAPMRQRLCRILAGMDYAPGALICAESIAQAQVLADGHPLSLALIDIGLPDGSGAELVRWLRDRDEVVPILVISQWNSEQTIVAALRAGATGYVLKGRDDLEIAVCLRSALDGGAPIDPFIAKHILGLFHAPPVSTLAANSELPVSARLPELSEREAQILNLVSKGLTNRDIAQTLILSRRTVEAHVNQIYRKLAVNSRTQAVFEARAFGLVG
jgi:DNA-binding NarL/FixJ family response regulator